LADTEGEPRSDNSGELTAIPDLPSFEELLISFPLYKTVDVGNDQGSALLDQIRTQGAGLDCYCVKCRRETTFRSVQGGQNTGAVRYCGPNADIDSQFALRISCQRCFTKYSYFFAHEDNKLTKVGQLPSSGDIAIGEFKDFSKGLNQRDRAELSRALGLASHDVPIAAFVYLRRIFERLIERARIRHDETAAPIADYDKMKTHERVAALKNFLPEPLVRNSIVFSILSRGIHELTEDDCALAFPVMKAAIFEMLAEEQAREQAAARAAATEREVQRVAGLLSRGGRAAAPEAS